jgi:hypothetical protein
MRLKSILFFNISLFLFAIASVLVTVANNNPTNSGTNVFITFYASFFLTLWTALTLFIFFLKSRFANGLQISAYYPTVRQALFLSISLTILLLLKGLNIFDWWVGVSIIIAFSLLELFFESKGNKNRI